MSRRPCGIQLGRTAPTGLLRAAEAALVLALAVASWGAFAIWKTRIPVFGAAGSGRSSEPVEGVPVFAQDEQLGSIEAAREAAALLQSGAPGAARLGDVLALIVPMAPDGFRITGVEVRPRGSLGAVEATVSAEVTAAGAVAAFLDALAVEKTVISTGVITETRRRQRATTVQVTAEIEASREAERQ